MRKLLTIVPVMMTACSLGPARTQQDLCSGQENNIAEDMRILESDLTDESASEAKEYLRTHPAETGNLPAEAEWARLNNEKIVRGHELREAARTETDPDVRKVKAAAFCAWLAKEGFYYD